MWCPWLLVFVALVTLVRCPPVQNEKCRGEQFWDDGLEICLPCEPLCSSPSEEERCRALCKGYLTSSTTTTTTKPVPTAVPTPSGQHGVGRSTSRTITALLIVVALLVLLFGFLVLMCYYKRIKKGYRKNENNSDEYCQKCYSYTNIATKTPEPNTYTADKQDEQFISAAKPLIEDATSQKTPLAEVESHILKENEEITKQSVDVNYKNYNSPMHHSELQSTHITSHFKPENATSKSTEGSTLSLPNLDGNIPGSLSLLGTDTQTQEEVVSPHDPCNFTFDRCQNERAANAWAGPDKLEQAVGNALPRTSNFVVQEEDVGRDPSRDWSYAPVAISGRNEESFIIPQNDAVGRHLQVESQNLASLLPQVPENPEPVAQQPASVQQGFPQDSGFGVPCSYPSEEDGGIRVSSYGRHDMGALLSSVSVASDAVSLLPPAALNAAREWMQGCNWIWGCARSRNNVHDIYVLDISLQQARQEFIEATGMRSNQFRICMLERPPELIPLSKKTITGALRCQTNLMTLGALLVIQDKLYALTCGHAVQKNSKVEQRSVTGSNTTKWEHFGVVTFIVENHWKPAPVDIALVEIAPDMVRKLVLSDSDVIVNPHNFQDIIGRKVQKIGMTSGKTTGIVENDYCKVPSSAIRPTTEPHSNEMEVLKGVLVVSDKGFASKGDSGSLVSLQGEESLVLGYLYGKLAFKIIPQPNCATKVTQYVVFSIKPALEEVCHKFHVCELKLYSTATFSPMKESKNAGDSGIFNM